MTNKLTGIILLLMMMSACNDQRAKNDAIAKVDSVYVKTEAIKRGKYLVAIAGCNDCHSTKMIAEGGPQPNPDFLLAGHLAEEQLPGYDKAVAKNWILFNMNATAFVGPWGTSFAANLTPHETGIGNWSYEQFKTAMQKGKYKGLETGRNLLPPMPWPNYAQMDDADLKAIFAYLKSLKPVNNLVPSPVAP